MWLHAVTYKGSRCVPWGMLSGLAARLRNWALRSGQKKRESECMGQLQTLSTYISSLAVNVRLLKRRGSLSPKCLIRCPQKGSVITVADWLVVILLKKEPCLGSIWTGKEHCHFCLTWNGKYRILRGLLQRQEVWTRWLLGFTLCSQVQVNISSYASQNTSMVPNFNP